jgi:hypothetical protein
MLDIAQEHGQDVEHEPLRKVVVIVTEHDKVVGHICVCCGCCDSAQEVEQPCGRRSTGQQCSLHWHTFEKSLKKTFSQTRYRS